MSGVIFVIILDARSRCYSTEIIMCLKERYIKFKCFDDGYFDIVCAHFNIYLCLLI